MNILFVCSGNTCRSVMAEYYLKNEIKLNNIPDLFVESCGTLNINNSKASEEVREILKKDGINAEAHRTKGISKDLIEKMDLILTMTTLHREILISRFPECKDKIFVFKEFVNNGNNDYPDIIDPIGQDYETYMKMANEIKECCKKLILKLKK